MYSAACWFGERAGATGGHRDTIVYPATPTTTGTIARIPSAVFNIVRSFPCVLTGAVCGLAWDVARVRT
jgi:hypothetical protein